MKAIYIGMILSILFAYGLVSQYEQTEEISYHQLKDMK
jgi:hypothetical protein